MNPLEILYTSLRNNDYDVPDTYESFRNTLTAPGQEGVDNRRTLYNSLKADNYDVPETYESFANTLFEPATKAETRKPAVHSPSVMPPARTSAEEAAKQSPVAFGRARVQSDMDSGKAVKSQDAGGFEITDADYGSIPKYQINRNPEWSKEESYAHSKKADNKLRPYYDLQDKDKEAFYAESRILDNPEDVGKVRGKVDLSGTQYRPFSLDEVAIELPLKDQIAAKARKREELLKKLNARGAALDAEAMKSSWGDRPRGGGALISTYNADSSNGRYYDDEWLMLKSAIDNLDDQINMLERAQDRAEGNAPGFFKSAAEEVSDMRNWDLGATDMLNAAAAARSGAGDKSEAVREADQEMLRAIQGKQRIEAIDASQAGMLESGGRMFGQMLPFMRDFFLMKPFEGAVVKGMTRGITRKLAKSAPKLMNTPAGKWTIKTLGSIPGDLAFAGVMTGGVQGASTMSDIVGAKRGDVVEKDGKLAYEDGKSWIDAIYNGIGDRLVENLSERSGVHIEGVTNYLKNTFMPKRISRIFTQAQRGTFNKIRNGLRKRFGDLGVADITGEVSEEYLGQGLRTIMGLDAAYKLNEDGSRTNLFLDPDFHKQILSGMALSMGFMNSIRSGITAASYYSARRALKKADSRAADRIGAERWDAIQEQLDEVTNEDVRKGFDLIQSSGLDEESAGLARDYLYQLMYSRGVNLGALSHSRGMDAEERDEAAAAESAYESGRDAHSSYENGNAEEIREIGERMDEAKAEIEEAFGDEADYYKSAIAQNAWGALEDPSLTGDQRAAILGYINAKAAFDGAIDAAKESADGKREQVKTETERRTNKDTGMILPAEMKAGGESVYIIDGEVAVMTDGTVDAGNSAKSIIILGADGEYRYVAPEMIGTVGTAMDPQEEMRDALEAVDSEQQGFAEAMQGESEAEAEPRIADAEEYDNGYEFGLNEAKGFDGDKLNAEIEKLRQEPDRLTDFGRGMLEAYEYEHQDRAAGAAEADSPAQKESEISPEEPETSSDRHSAIAEHLGERYSFSEEKANNGEVFYQDENGDTNLAVIPDQIFDKIGINPLPFKLTETMAWHVYQNHAKELKLNNIDDAIDFVLDTINNVDHVRLGRDNSYIFSVENGRNKLGKRSISIVINTQSGNFLGIKTSGYEQLKKLKERPILWSQGTLADSEAVATPTVTTIKAQQGDEHVGRTEGQSTDALSEGKDNVLPTDKQTEGEKSALGRVPVDEAGKPVWTAADPETAWDALVEKTGEAESAQAFAQMQISRAKDAVKKAEKVKVASTDDIEEFTRADKARRKGIEDAENVLRRWEAVAGIPEQRAAAAKAEREERERAEREEQEAWEARKREIDTQLRETAELVKDCPEAVDILENMNPQDIYEAAALALSTNKVIPQSDGVHKGFRGMTGYGNEEQKGFFGLFAKAENGGKSIERIAEDTMQGICDEYGIPYDNLAARDALVDVLQSCRTLGEIRSYIRHSRMDQALRTYNAWLSMQGISEEDAIAEAEAEFYCKYGMTVAEYEDLREVVMADIEERDRYFDENEYYGNIADEMRRRETGGKIETYDTGREETGDTRRDGSLQEPESPGEREASGNGDALLPEGGLDNGRGAGADEPRQGIHAESGAGVADPQEAVSARASGRVDAEPTEAQKEAGNYKMEHRRVDGYNISIENPKGSVRRGKGADGKPWETAMQNAYGYIRGTEGVDGDHIDVFLSDTPEDGDVFVVDQVNEDGSFDEHKVMYGFASEDAARKAYLSNYEPGWTGLGAITHVSKEEFKKWIQSSKRKTKPFAEYKSVKAIEGNGMIGRSLTEQEATELIERMKAAAEIAPSIELTPENWIAQFGEDGTVETPIGIVKMGANQLLKLYSLKRTEYFSMIHPTLNTPDVIIEKNAPAEGAERDSKYLFVKTFIKPDGSRLVHFESVTVQRDGMEVSISSHEAEGKAIKKEMQNGKILHLSESLSPSSERYLTEAPSESEGPDLVPTSDNIVKGKEREDGQSLILPSESSEEAGALSSPTLDSPSDRKDNTLSADKQAESAGSSRSALSASPQHSPDESGSAFDSHDNSEPYTITATTYTNKKGKASEVHLVKFNRELTAEEKAALGTFVREPLTEGKKTSRGWYDRKQGGYMMRSEGAARQLAEMIGNEDAVADAQPMTAEELREAVAPATPAEKKPARKPKKAPINRVSLEDVMTDLSTKGETKLSDRAKPENAEPEKQHEISDEEMQSLADELRDLLGIGDDEGDTNIKFRDPGELTPQERQRIQSAGIRLAMGLIERGTTAFPDYATKMVGLLGAKIRPWLKSFYEGARWTPGYDKYTFTPTEQVATFDVQNFDKKQADPIAQAAMIVEERKASTASAQAQKELTETRNKNRRENDKQTEADTATLAEKAEAVAGKAESLAETSEDTAELNRATEEIDNAIEGINEQLALLGYYEYVEDDAKFHESYGYMLTAERKAVADTTKLAKQLANDLGIDIKVTSATTPLGRKSVKKGTAVRANLAPAGGDVTVNLPLNEGRQLAIYIGLEPVAEKGTRRRGDNLAVERILYRVENPNGKGMERYGRNIYAPTKITYADFLRRIKNDAREYLPLQKVSKAGTSDATDLERIKSADGIFGEAQRAARAAQEKKKSAITANKKTKVKPEQPVADLFGGLFDEPINDEKKTDVQPRPGTAERERGHEPQSHEPLGESQRNEVKGTDGRGMGGRDSVNPMSDRERGAGISRKPKSQPVTERVPESERKNVRNNHAERGVDYAPKGEDARIKANIEAIELAKRLLDAGETATPEQMAVLRKFSGWGGLGKAFNEQDHTLNPIAKRLKELLGEDGYQDAVDSRRSAYYTPAEIIGTMWDVARAMGFKGGNVLEGAAGIGNIIGLMPADMSERSSIHAVEIDRTTGGILSLLYPDAQVDVQGFEKTKIRNNTIDLSITNVPFVTGLRVMDETGDKDLSKKFHDIHDFCIAKNIRKLREGGIGIFITSSGTMDNSKELRRWIINEGNADVVGAFRMHNKTFGGTGATSDIIVVRKRVNGKPSPNAIDVTDVTGVRVADYDTGDTRKVKGQEIPIVNRLSMDYNKYFAEHPEFMAGEMRFGFEEGDTFRPKSKALYPVKGKEQGEMLTAWAERFADMEEEAATPKVEDEVTRINEQLGEGVKEGSMVLNSQGELCMARMGEAVPLGLNKNKVKGHTKAECFKAYSAIKKALSDVLEYQSSHEGDEGLAPLLKELNRAFDTFTRTYGNLHKNIAISFLRNDVDFSSILALETYSEKGDKKGNKVVKVGKTDIFSRRVIDTEKEPQPTTIKDAILASLYKSGGVDVEYIGQALGKQTEEVKREIVSSGLGFENPSTGTMEVSYKYLSGNVREKLHIAQENNADGRYDANIKALEGVMPMTIPAHLIEFSLGSSWIEPKLYEDFVFEKTGLRVTLTNAGGTWFMKTPWNTFNEKNRAMAVVSKMCDKTIMGHELIEAAITNRQITVSKTEKHYDGSTETITDKAATAECGTKVDEIRADFKDWAREHMQADPAMSARIEQTYNDQFNNYVPMSIPDDFVPQHFGGQVSELHGHPFALRPHQGRAVVRGTTEPILLAHEVGTGKTYTLITTAMEMRRLGTARKPMIVVQNATVGQFVESAKEIYPNAKVLTIEEADRTAEGRRNFYAKIKYNDWDMIVVPQSVFERIPDSEEREMAYVKDIIEEKMKVLEAMREADSDGRSMIVRQAERELAEQEARLAELTETMQGKKKKRDEKREATTRQNAEVRALEMLDREVDDVENFDDMGIDAILVDEAHEYKHLGFATAMQRGVKGVDPSYSKKSQGVFLKAQAVMERNNGRNVVFATGTPISNTAAEIWTFMRYLMPVDTMKSYGIYYFDDFVRNFGNIAQMVEFSTNGKFKENNRFAGYVNLPELVRMWSSVADTVLTREAGGVSDKIPDMEGGKPQDIYLPQTRALRSVMKYVKAELDRFEEMSGKEKKENSHIPLTMYGIAKAAAVDVRLVIPNAEDDPYSKTNATVRETLRSLKDSAKYKGTVAIFSDNYQNNQSGFNLYEDIRKKLIAEGVPAEQIVVIKSGMTVKKKLDIFEKVNAGEIRVIMGSTFTLGTGVNIQERLHTLIHVDAPNRPMDYTQRNGRALRQGNLHKDMGIPVRIIRFGVEDSLDVTAYQRLKTKGAIADSIMNGSKMMQNSMENRVLEEEEDSFGDMTAQLSGSEYAILKNQAEREVRNLTAKQKGHDLDQIYVHNQLPKVEGFIKGAERRIEIETKNLEIIGSHFPDGTIKKITIGKLTFDSVAAMEDFFKEQNAKMNEAAENVREGADNYTSKLVVDVDGLKFEVTTTVSRTVDSKGQGTLTFEPERNVTYSCEALGIKDESVKGNRLKNVMQKIAEDIVTGRESRELLSRGQQQLAHYTEERTQLEQRNGREFPYKQQLAEAKERLAKYEEAMKKELAEKEAKYAELDKSVETASGITLIDEESADAPAAREGNKYRDGEGLSDGERLRAIRALKPIEVERNEMSRAELFTEYRTLPDVLKDGSRIQFLRTAFGKNYKTGGLFAQVVPQLGELLSSSILAYSEKDSLGGTLRPDGTEHKAHPNVASFDNYVNKAIIDGQEYYVRMTVQKTIDTTTGLHSCFVSNVDVYEKTATGVTDSAISRRPKLPYDGVVDAKLQQFFERASSEANMLDMRDRVEELSEKLNTPVRIITKEGELREMSEDGNPRYSRRERRAKGWWSAKDDEVVIVLPNNVNVADVDNTFVHEVVGHKGLRAFIGEERFDEFLGEIYDHASNPIRKVIDKMTDRLVEEEAERKVQAAIKDKPIAQAGFFRNAFEATAKREAEKKREEFRREATEEYMADLGGRIGSEGFEKMSREELTLWGKIKAKVQAFLDKFLQGLKIAKSIRLNDKHLAYILYKSWKNARDSKGKGGVFSEAEDAVMRHRTGWDAEMQVSEKRARIEKLRRSEPVEVTDEMIPSDVDITDRKAIQKNLLNNIRGEYRNADTGETLQVLRQGIEEVTHHGMADPAHIKSLFAIPEMIKKAIFIDEHPNNKEKRAFESYRYYVCGLKINEEDYTAKIVAGVKDGQRYYDHRLTQIEKGAAIEKAESFRMTAASNNAPVGADKVMTLERLLQIPDNENEDTFRFRDGDLGLEEYITKTKADEMQKNAGNLQARNEAMRAIGGNLSHLRQAMARQKEYDITTVKSVSDLAKVLMDTELLDDLSKGEIKRILGAINNAVGKQDVSRYVQRVMDIMIDNQLRIGKKELEGLLKIRGSGVDARGIEVQGALDPEGQRIAQVVKKASSLPKDDIESRIDDALDRMGNADQAIADEAAVEYQGLLIARRYVEEITESKAEETNLRDSIKQAKAEKDAGQMPEDVYRQYVESTEEAIRQNKIERAEAYNSLIEQIGGVLGDSVERAKAWREAERQRVEEIHHNANSDMEGRPADEHHKEGKIQKFVNNDLARFLLAPLGTFDQMLRMFGKKNTRGEGYLWNRYMRGWVSAAEKEYMGYRNALKVLDTKVGEIFGKGKKWSDLFGIDRHLPKAAVRFFDGGEMKDHELTQGNLLYIYMADKMSDGRMKLRRMGITEADVEDITNFLDPRFIQLADWMQEEFLVDKRNEYNEVHKRMFGASMAAIENYFPLKVLANARTEDVDVADDAADTALPATSTGSIIKRRRNNLALDVTGANAFTVILDHLQEMERWAAFAEFNRDLNTLLSYKRFRNQVMSMSSAYGAGKTLWKNFRNVCSMAAGAYRPPIAPLDKAAVNVAKGVTAAKVSFRVFTALKQFLSMPAYISDSNPVYLAANIVNPAGAWKWCMENLPLFDRRWNSRMAGDPRLMKSEMDWKMWRSRVVEIAARVGMSPNAFVDALTVAIGAHSMYQTKLSKYKRMGYDPDVAEARAKQDATILFNQTQQSSESAFLSTMQADRSWLSVLFTIFRNSSMSYTRQLYDALRNIGRRMKPGYKAMSLEFMEKQMIRDGIDPGNASENAKREYRRGIIRDLVRVGIFGYGLQLAWNLGAYLPYLIFGDDDETKDEFWRDVWTHTMFGSIEGLTGGDVYSNIFNAFAKGEKVTPWVAAKDMPLSSDIETIWRKWNNDEASAVNDVINLLAQSAVGVNPQTLTDVAAAILDYCGDDAQTSRECALLMTRIINCPQSQIDKIYLDEVGLTGREACALTPAQLAKRYADYKMMREAPLTGWMRDGEAADSLHEKRMKPILTAAKENITAAVMTEKTRRYVEEYKANEKRREEIGKLKDVDRAKYNAEVARFNAEVNQVRRRRMKRYVGDIKELTERYLKTESPEELQQITDSMFRARDVMLQDVEGWSNR